MRRFIGYLALFALLGTAAYSTAVDSFTAAAVQRAAIIETATAD